MCHFDVNRTQWLSRIENECQTPHSDKAGWKPALAVQDASPPPLLVCGVHYFNDVSSLESELLIIHGDVIP